MLSNLAEATGMRSEAAVDLATKHNVECMKLTPFKCCADCYITNGEVVTHSHGPQGMHSHGLIDFTQAALQALSIHDALLQSVPEAKKKKGSTQGMG